MENKKLLIKTLAIVALLPYISFANSTIGISSENEEFKQKVMDTAKAMGIKDT